MLGRIVKHHLVARIGKKSRPRGHRFENATLALFTQVVLDTVMGRHKPHQAFGLMSIEVVGDKMPPRGLRITGYGLLQMSHEVLFGARRPYRGGDHLALSDVEIGD